MRSASLWARVCCILALERGRRQDASQLNESYQCTEAQTMHALHCRDMYKYRGLDELRRVFTASHVF